MSLQDQRLCSPHLLDSHVSVQLIQIHEWYGTPTGVECILVSGSRDSVCAVGDPGTVFVWDGVCSRKGVKDVTSRSAAPFTGGSAAHVIVSRVAGVDVFRIRSVFSFLDIASAIGVNNSYGNWSIKGIGQVCD